ncbi:unnamed protein product [Urochloa humidicola]
MASSVAAAASTFLGTRLADPAPQNGRIVARFGFGKKPAAPKKAAKTSISSDRPLWYPGAVPPEYLDGSYVGDYGFDPWGLGKPVEYLQFDLDSLDQNLAKNEAGGIIGTRFESSEVKSTPLQPYSEVFGLQRFRECELIHGRWAMLATLGALSVEWLTGVTWQDAGGACGRVVLPGAAAALLHLDADLDRGAGDRVHRVPAQRGAGPGEEAVPGGILLRPAGPGGGPGEEGAAAAGGDQARAPRHGRLPRLRRAGSRHRQGAPQQLGHPPQRPAPHHHPRHVRSILLSLSIGTCACYS